VSRRATAVRWAQTAGFDPVALRALVRHGPGFIRDVRRYGRDPAFPLRVSELRPMLADLDGEAGVASGHYFHQDLWAARLVHERRPARHLDVGSRVDGFVAHLLTFMPVEIVDIRALEADVAGLTVRIGDMTTLEGIATGSVDSLSSLHAVEHVGLGRYGDTVDADGWRRALHSLARVLAPGGRLYLSVPVGRQRLEFNAQRVFDPDTVLRELVDLELVSFSAVGDDGDLHLDVAPSDLATAEYGCGLFELTRA